MSWKVDKSAFKGGGGGGGGGGRSFDRWPPNRFWMPPDSARELFMVDDTRTGGETILEHQFKMDGHWRNWFTSRGRNNPEDPIQKYFESKGIKPWHGRSVVHYITVVDCTGFQRRDGTQVKFELQLYGCKKTAFEYWEDEYEEAGPVAGHVFKVKRRNIDKEPNVGGRYIRKRKADPFDVFKAAEYQGKKLSDMWDAAEADETKMAELQRVFQVEFDEDGKLLRKVVPFNYDEVLKPLPEEEIIEKLEGYYAPKDAYLDEDAKKSNGGSPSFGGSSNDAFAEEGAPDSDDEDEFVMDDTIPF